MHAAGIVGATLFGAAALTDARWSATADLPSRSSLWALHPIEAIAPTVPPTPLIAAEPTPPETALVDPALPLVEAQQVEARQIESPLPTMPTTTAVPNWLETVVRPLPVSEPAEVPPTEPAVQAAAATAAPMGGGLVQPSPRASDNAPPRYPFVAWRRGIEGTVIVILEVDDRGAVTAAHVETSSGCGQLDDAALQALRRWRFTPAHRGDWAVRGTWRQTVEFRLTGDAVALPSVAGPSVAGDRTRNGDG